MSHRCCSLEYWRLKMNDKKILSWQIEKFLKNPILSAVLLLMMVGILFTQDTQSGVIATVFVVIYVGILVTYYFRVKPEIMTELVKFASEHGQIQKQLLKDLTVPYILTDLKR